MLTLRPWQTQCASKADKWFKDGNRTFLMNVAPGGGKTKASCVIAKKLLEDDEIDCVVAIAPRRPVVHQWADDFQQICGRTMLQITGSDEDLGAYTGIDFAITWSSLNDASAAFYQICQNKRVLAICDEHHHAGQGNPWGDGADNARLAMGDARGCRALARSGAERRAMAVSRKYAGNSWQHEQRTLTSSDDPR